MPLKDLENAIRMSTCTARSSRYNLCSDVVAIPPENTIQYVKSPYLENNDIPCEKNVYVERKLPQLLYAFESISEPMFAVDKKQAKLQEERLLTSAFSFCSIHFFN